MHTKHLMAFVVIGMALCSCSSKLGTLSSDNFTLTPQPLEEKGGKVTFAVSGRFPEKFFKKNAELSIVPVLRYDGGEAVAKGAAFQGEKVFGNAQEISYLVGGNFTLRGTFEPFQPDMEQSEMLLRMTAKVGGKPVAMPDVKIGTGVVATATRLGGTIGPEAMTMAEDRFQYAVAQQREAQVRYLVAQTRIRNSELETTSIKDFIRTLGEIKSDGQGYQIENIQISSYASPEGSVKLNASLAEGRDKSAAEMVEAMLKEKGLTADMNRRYTAEDWDGFQEIVSRSNLQDKDLILRVLQMYTDPEEREQQIRNLSAAYTELADAVLPELRRSRLVVNYMQLGRSDADIMEQFKADPTKLTADELLYGATLCKTFNEREGFYVAAASQYPDDYRAYNNLAIVSWEKNDMDLARIYLDEALQKAPNAAEPNANKALMLLHEGKAEKEGTKLTEEVEGYLSKATEAKNYKQVLGMLRVAQGQYQDAATQLAGTPSDAAALAQLLNKDYLKAAETLSYVAKPTAETFYLRAIVAARTGQGEYVYSNLKSAVQMDSSIRLRALRDVELAKYRNTQEFLDIVK